jgi:hypothetical protein
MKVRLMRKFAEFIDGVDLTHRHVGDVIDVSHQEAEILMAEEWAAPADDSTTQGRATADDAPRRSRKRPR